MKKVIIIGHPDSNYQEVEKIFQMYGMAPALPSKCEKMTPIEIGEVLQKVQSQGQYPLLSIDTSVSPAGSQVCRKMKTNKKRKKSNYTQVATISTYSIPSLNSMWDALPMDLMLANIGQDFWGWSDPKAIELLDYWANIDPSIHFVFIYDKPQNIFQYSSLEEALTLDETKIQEKFSSWENYNQRLLNAFNKYKARSVLISAQRIQETVLQSTSEIYKQIAVPNTIIDNLIKEQELIEDIQDQEAQMKQNKECSLSTLIVENIMQDNQHLLNLYEELQNYANFPYITESLPNKNSKQALKAWKVLIQQKIESQKQINKNQHIQNEKEKVQEVLNQQLYNLQLSEKELESSKKNNKDLENKNSTLHKKNIELEKKYSNLEKLKKELENKSNTLQIKNNDIDKLNNTLKNQNNELEKQNLTLQAKHRDVENSNNALKNQNNELEKQKANAENQTKHTQNQLHLLEDENNALMAQLNFTQEELERLFLENKKLKEQPPLWGAGDRIRNQLTYRIGHKLQQHGKSPIGWIKLPFVLLSTYRQYNKDKKQNEWQKLPAIHLYQDAYEAEKVKNHLSYKLGSVFMREIKNPLRWILIPQKLITEGKAFK
ncbi:hypothetical protein A1D29_00300 [Pasteurellaceae bacterium Orientalotternb1]|nr:hypothetical protein A1D29_00300 [Pasteurellaceae bacterium Orientalotternb1]